MSGDAFSWNGGTGAFSDPSQWTDETTPDNTGVVAPGAQDSASFTKGGSVSGSGTVAALSLDSDVTLLSGASITTGNLDLSGTVSFDANASLSVTNDDTVTNLVGLLTLDQGASLAFTGAGGFFDVGLGTPNTGELDINQAQVSGTELMDVFSGSAVNVTGVDASLTVGEVDAGVVANTATPSTAVAELNVSDGGSVSSSALFLAYAEDDTSLVIDSGTWNADGAVAMHPLSATATALIENAGTLIGTELDIGPDTNGAASVTVDGVSSLIQMPSGLSIAGASLTVQNQGTLSTGGGDINAGGTVLVTSRGTWTLDATAFDRGTLLVQGGTVLSRAFDIDGLASATGTGAAWTSSGPISLGFVQSGTLTLDTGASLEVQSNMTAGVSAGVSGTIGIGAATLAVTGNVTIGVNGTGLLKLAAAASLDIGGGLTLGAASGAGTFDAGGDPTIHGDLDVNNGLADIVQTVPLTVDGAIAVGQAAGSNGHLLLEQNALLTGGTGDVTVGSEGNGTLTVNAGATFDATASAITAAESAGSAGTITVDGLDALLQADGLTIGGASTTDLSPSAFLTLQDGAAVQVTNTFEIGADAGSYGQATITGDGSTLEAGAFSVGGSGTGAFTVQPGAAVSASGDASVGGDSGGNGTWSINRGSASVGGTLTVGDSGNGLGIIQQGGTLHAASVEIGNKLGGTGEIDETGGNLISDDVSVGSGGTGDLKISGGSVVTNGNVDVAQQVNATVQTLSVGNQAVWNIGGTLTVGAAGIADATIDSAAVVSVNGGVVVGDQSGASGVLIVSGSLVTAGGTTVSAVSYGGVLQVGNGGDGILRVQQSATVAPTPGGPGEIDVAVAAGETSTLAVDGVGSFLHGGIVVVGGAPGAAGGTGTLGITNGGSILASAVKIWSGGLISLGGILEVQGSLSGPGTISMDPSLLQLDSPDSATAPVANFTAGDTIDLKGVAPASVSYAAGVLTFAGGSFALGVAGGTVHAAASADGTAVTACFCAGTRILTDVGEVSVELLQPGMRVPSIKHQRWMPVCWVGWRHVDRASPVKITAGALGEGKPDRDLWLSPDHALFVDGRLLPAHCLVNGVTVAEDHSAQPVTYYHVELAEHGVLLANGLPVESYLDTGNRTAFEECRIMSVLPSIATPSGGSEAAAAGRPTRECSEAQRRGLVGGKLRWRRSLQFLGHPVSHDEFLHLAAAGHGEAVNETDMHGDFLVRDLALAELPQTSLVQAGTAPQANPSANLLAPVFVWHAEHLDVAD
jgi:T5SS/PEP-CTERM-associated repeat protein